MAHSDYQIWLASWPLIRAQLEDKLAAFGQAEIAEFLDELEYNLSDITNLLRLDLEQAKAARCTRCDYPLSLIDLAHGEKRCFECSTGKKYPRPTLSA